MLKWCLDERTRRKIHVLRSFDGILKYVDKDNIPKAMVADCDLFLTLSSFYLFLSLFREAMMIISSTLMIILTRWKKTKENLKLKVT
jgi:hypothetical protein